MADLNIAETLQLGIKAHQANEIEEANNCYTTILNAQPDHPDANHNLGVLTLDLGKIEESLPYFETALKSKADVIQYWLSYIGALLKLGRYDDSEKAIIMAKAAGVPEPYLDQFNQQLSLTSKIAESEFEEIIQNAVKLLDVGKSVQAIPIIKKHLGTFPKALKLHALLARCYLLTNEIEEVKKTLALANEIERASHHLACVEVRLLMKVGDTAEALQVATQNYEKFPNELEVMTTLASCLRVNKKFDQAVAILNNAISIDPNNADAFANLALIKLSEGKTEEALKDFLSAFRINPYLKETWRFIIGILIDEQKYDHAIKLLIQMIKIDPYDDNNLMLITSLLEKIDDYELAKQSFEIILQFNPKNHSLYFNHGLVSENLNFNLEAIHSYKKSLMLQPNNFRAHSGLGRTYGKLSRFNEAIDHYVKALDIKSDDRLTMYNLAVLLKGRSLNKPNKSIENILERILDDQTVARPNYISHATIALLKFDPKFRSILTQNISNCDWHEFSKIVIYLSKLKLLNKIMRVCPIPDPDIETLLIKLRKKLLLTQGTVDYPREVLDFQTSLALQCFMNEYIYTQNDEEVKKISILRKDLEKSLANNTPPDIVSMLCFASYHQINELKWRNSSIFPKELNEVLKHQYYDSETEKHLQRKVKSLSQITNSISTKVMEQYEKNPYPRWANVAINPLPMSIRQMTRGLGLRILNDAIYKIEEPSILIAGCGTGQHSIGSASNYKHSTVLAIDLSKPSLAYALRKTEELNIENIEYMQADILDLRKLDKQFDVIECSGVLHHMDKPLDGWQVLKDSLVPGGIMKIALYSDIARKHIATTRNEIADARLEATNNNIKHFRENLLSSKLKHHQRIVESSDFYSTSMLRDLLFHVKEHRYTIDSIENCLEKLGLHFCGFSDLSIRNRFIKHYQSTEHLFELDAWRRFEELYPTTFGGMYQFWCQKLE